MTSKKINVQVQHFVGCPNSGEMIERVKEAINQLQFEIEYEEILVDTPELSRQLNFCGSPTVLVNEIDLENLPEPQEANLACRYYRNGLPTVEGIKNFIMQKVNSKERR